MNYYSHHIGDFNSGTRNFSRLERWLYRDMLEMYYDSEKPLTADYDKLCDELGAESNEEKAAVTRILRRKFEITEDGYTHERCEAEIFAYQRTAEKARENGKKGGRPMKSKTGQEPKETNPVYLDNPTLTQPQANQEPITNNHKPDTSPIPPKGAKRRASKPTIAFQTYLSECKDADVKPIPESDSVFDYAAEAGLSHEILSLHWNEFRARYTLEGAKRYKDWPTVFRKSVRGNWFHLWYSTQDGSFALTAAGMQAKNVADAAKRKAA